MIPIHKLEKLTIQNVQNHPIIIIIMLSVITIKDHMITTIDFMLTYLGTELVMYCDNKYPYLYSLYQSIEQECVFGESVMKNLNKI